jgi:hypothetical protein
MEASPPRCFCPADSRDGGEILSGFAFAHASPVVKRVREKRGSLSCLALPEPPSAN